ncbi:MAG: hypothetical protein MOB07_14205 [Acidobacteria bacterium]|nr:hypothetical protein [Acidobacteriota bacterium]
MSELERDEFYVGYLPRAPRKVARWVQGFCLTLFVIAALLAILLVVGQHKFPLSVFEFQQYRQVEGIMSETPYPSLLVQRPGDTGRLLAVSQYLLVAPGKHGATGEVGGLNGQRVLLQGSLIYRDGLTMIEVVPHSLKPVVSTSKASGQQEIVASTEDLGTFTLVGEIVDSKCYLGVMNPGNTKPHRECAALCISGGIPPLLIAHDADGRTVSLLLVSANNEPVNQEVLHVVAEPVEITGRVVREGEQLILRADPKAYRRVR